MPSRFRIVLSVAISVFGVWGFTGCTAPEVAVEPTRVVLDISDYDGFINGALSVLRRHDFSPEYVDRTRGTIISSPTTSAQWFEFWRIDAPGPYQRLESSLHTVRRSVRVNVEPVAGESTASPATQPAGGRYAVTVRVDKARYTAPERQITTTSGALALFNPRVPTASGARGAASLRETGWVPLGQDAVLEEMLLRRMLDQPAVALIEE